MLRIAKIDARGHIIERNVVNTLYASIKHTSCDIRDMSIYISSLKNDMNEQRPSEVNFSLVAMRGNVERTLKKVEKILKDYGFEIISSKKFNRPLEAY
jgi:hypothetical protein